MYLLSHCFQCCLLSSALLVRQVTYSLRISVTLCSISGILWFSSANEVTSHVPSIIVFLVFIYIFRFSILDFLFLLVRSFFVYLYHLDLGSWDLAVKMLHWLTDSLLLVNCSICLVFFTIFIWKCLRLWWS